MVKVKARSRIVKNIKIIGVLFFVLFTVAVVRAYSLQILKAGKLSEMIDSQSRTNFELTPYRGSIYDTNGMELAVSLDVKSVYARPNLIENTSEAAKKLSRILERPEKEILGRLTSERRFVWVQRKISPAKAMEIEALRIRGINFVDESQRFYPNKSLAGQVLGFVGTDAKGLEGIELQYNAILSGKPRYLTVGRDALGRRLFLEEVTGHNLFQGYDITLTIDKNIQHIAEKELEAAVALSNAKNGMAVVMDPSTGAVLALALVPRFNPNNFRSFSAATWKNRAVTDLFEPGSTFKTFLVAAAIERDAVKPWDSFFCENGIYRISNRTIRDVHPHEWLTVSEIIKHSSNIGVSKISRYVETEDFFRYIRGFGFGLSSQIDFPGEACGFVPIPHRLPEHTKSAISFGYSVSVTAVQLAAAYSAIANGGMLYTPYFVKRVSGPDGMTIQTTEPNPVRRVVSEETADTMTQMLETVVSSKGTGRRAYIEGYSVAGKTGTTRKLDAQGQYSSRKLIASFVGFVPADNPRATILVLIDEPQRLTFGGEVAAPAFGRIARQVLNYMNIAPDRPLQPDGGLMREVKSKHIEEVVFVKP